MLQPHPKDPLNPELLNAVETELTLFLDSQAPLASEITASPMVDVARTYISGGKRLRPAFCYWGYVTAAGQPADSRPLIRAAASLDVLHASLVTHDDLIDRSNTRRGQPAAHRQYEKLHRFARGTGSAEGFGAAAAILVGDALLSWSVEMYENSGLAPEVLGRARGLMQTMRTEVLLGQYLDVAAAYRATGVASAPDLLSQAERILEYKSARYSIRRPLEVGALLGGAAADSELLAALGRYGSLVGGAFQLRDDVLGVFGDPAVTGKPAGDDLREGKRTLLVLEALARCDGQQRAVIEGLLGAVEPDPDAIGQAREIITRTGATDVIEQHIAERTASAIAIVESTDLTDDAATALITLAELATRRER